MGFIEITNIDFDFGRRSMTRLGQGLVTLMFWNGVIINPCLSLNV